MPTIQSFAPIARRDAVVLILGTVPSRASLAAGQFYGHPQNAFWKIMGELFDAGREVPYAERQRRLKRQRVAVWDVLRECEREGSLDSAIVAASEVPNDFVTFFARHRQIRAVFFNGTKAEQTFRRKILPELNDRLDGIHLERLPSTSPANASYRYEQKLARWRRILVPLE